MLKSQDLQIQISGKRSRLAELLGKPERSESELNELDAVTSQIRDSEIEFRAAVTAENNALDEAREQFDDDGEAAELRSIRRQVRVGKYLKMAAEGRSVTTGAESEFNQALNMGADAFPLLLLAGDEPEQRTTSDVDTKTSPHGWLDRLFADSMAMYLGINFQSVSPGIASFPITKTGGAGAQRGRAEDTTEAAWTIGTNELKPSRNAVHLVFSKEDTMRIPMLEAALTRDLRAALMESIDRAIFLGDTGANENVADISGLSTAASVVEKTLSQANKLKAGATLEVFNGLIDGLHASGVDDLRVVASEGTHQLWSKTVLSVSSETASVFKTLSKFLMENDLSWRVRKLESATTNGKFGAFISRSRGLTGASACPVWAAGELVRDVYSKAKSGECLLTLSYYWNFGLPRPTNFARLKFMA